MQKSSVVIVALLLVCMLGIFVSGSQLSRDRNVERLLNKLIDKRVEKVINKLNRRRVNHEETEMADKGLAGYFLEIVGAIGEDAARTVFKTKCNPLRLSIKNLLQLNIEKLH